MRVIGLMSGTSMDGIDAALVQIKRRGVQIQITLLRFATTPYPRRVRERLFRITAGVPVPLEELCRLNVLLGELFAQATGRLIRRAGLSSCAVALIGSHGQTICHFPEPERVGRQALKATLQIGEPSIIAQRTGITTVADFRPRDQAAGGHGAPLTPYLHAVLFRHRPKIG